VVFSARLFGVALLFWYALILTIGLWYFLEYTAAGRRLLFVGRGREVARFPASRWNGARGALVAPD